MDKKTEQKKVFLDIVQQLRQLIKLEKIQAGEKLPSERVLSERLGVGRSSVREALRSLELLGLIETRHGGGTFLASTQKHQLVEILSMFILEDEKSKKDVELTRQIHEKEAIRVISCTETLRTLPVWDSFFVKLEIEGTINCRDVLREIIITSGNRLSLKVWFQLAVYDGDRLNRNSTEEEKIIIQTMLKSMQLGYEKEALKAYEQWMRIVQSN
ncbi:MULTISPECIES: GntR family transcriptional regulator [unclassified Lysinibacillus]|uniref:FadR/GntR family transcriptional regulator n=1 Tax=unclassified Lysinibacillus TaxID=2636778 RepID=UPI002010C794|nr:MULTISPECIES: GntR family transcriptional regulator [unclassified Lysinibacillus]MCL1695247.1 GntR family transcriptional regulator [Lysinibacillus sp. BPa_S21]MCL1701075.1 GntR family transcriptional regulator [Lysinibacillus sp. Bpr_S20]